MLTSSIGFPFKLLHSPVPSGTPFLKIQEEILLTPLLHFFLRVAYTTLTSNRGLYKPLPSYKRKEITIISILCFDLKASAFPKATGESVAAPRLELKPTGLLTKLQWVKLVTLSIHNQVIFCLEGWLNFNWERRQFSQSPFTATCRKIILHLPICNKFYQPKKPSHVDQDTT